VAGLYPHAVPRIHVTRGAAPCLCAPGADRALPHYAATAYAASYSIASLCAALSPHAYSPWTGWHTAVSTALHSPLRGGGLCCGTGAARASSASRILLGRAATASVPLYSYAGSRDT